MPLFSLLLESYLQKSQDSATTGLFCYEKHEVDWKEKVFLKYIIKKYTVDNITSESIRIYVISTFY